jgi:fascin 1/2
MWSGTVGLVNGQYKYLTAETFGYKINANGVGLKKKQQWTIEPFPTNGEQNGSSRLEDIDELENVCIRSHLNCYLAVDSFGNVTCESQERTEGARFTITICSMSQGMAQGLKSIILSITLSK